MRALSCCGRLVRAGRACPLPHSAAPPRPPRTCRPRCSPLACAPTLVFEAPADARCGSPAARTRSIRQQLRARRPDHDQRRHRQRHRGRSGVSTSRRVLPRERRADQPRQPRARSARPAGSASTPWTTQMSLATDRRTRATRSTSDDYLEPFVLPPVPTMSADRAPSRAARQLRPRDGRQRSPRSFGKRRLLRRRSRQRSRRRPPARGSSSIATSSTAGNFLFELGEAVAVDVRPESSTLQVDGVARRVPAPATTSRIAGQLSATTVR